MSQDVGRRRVFRRLGSADAPAIARLARAARQAAIAFLPDLHTPAEDVAFYERQISCGIGLCVEESGEVLGFALGQGQMIDHLYVDVGWQRQGIGSTLLDRMCQALPDQPVRLWTFQSNAGAIAFYRHHGFVVVDQTDGSGNEEGLPDFLLQRPPA